MAYHLLTPIIASFCQQLRPHPLEQINGSVLIEDDDQVHRLECGEDFGPRLHVLHGAATSLQPPYPSIAIEPYDQAITKPVRLRQELDVTWMENIEAAVREADPCAHSAPFGEP